MVRNVTIVSLLALYACGDATGRPEAIAVRDSAGVEIVELAELSGSVSWRVMPDPLWSFTDAENGPIHNVLDVAFVADGRIAVSEASRSLVLLLDAGGSELARGGTPGRGPGEFVRIGPILPLDADSFRVVDLGDGSLTTWSMEGRLLGEIPLPGTSIEDVVPGRAGGIYIAYRAPLQPEVADTVQRAWRPVARWQGEKLDTLMLVPGNDVIRNDRAIGSPAYYSRGLVRGNRSGLWAGDTRYPEVHHRSDDAITRIVRWVADPVPMTPEIMGAYLDAVTNAVASTETAEVAQAIRQEISTWPAVRQIPFWEEMVVAYDGSVWISPDVTMRLPPELGIDLAPRRWVVLDPAGRPVAEVTTPAGFALHDVSRSTIVGVYTDELGAQSVRAYTVER